MRKKTLFADQTADIELVGDELTASPEAFYWSTTAADNPLRSYEWYLDGPLTAGSNPYGANIDKISTEYSGRGVLIGLIDEGFDLSHPDLANRFDLTLSYDPRDSGTISILPDSVSSAHGTWVAGVIGAAADNSFGTVGVAPGSTLVGHYARFGFGGSSRAEMTDLLARQINVDVSNNSWGYTTQFADNFRDPAWAAMQSAIQNATANGRDGLGTAYVFAAGNDRQFSSSSLTYDGDNTNYHSLTNSRYVITVAATTQDGHVTSFSTPGASILVAAPGEFIATSGVNNGDGNVANDYAFGSGTSFSAPIISGVIALMLEANPELGYRDVQEILALSARKIDPTSANWSTNGATNWNGGANLVSHDLGFGLVDAHAAVRLAETWTTTHTATNEAVISLPGTVTGDPTFVDFQPKTYTVNVGANYQNFSVGWVEVDVSLLHTHVGDLRIELVSPTGTRSVLMDRPAAGTNARDNLTFTFSTTHDWGESPVGTWSLIVTDNGPGGSGSMVSFAVRIYGDDLGENDAYYYTDDFATLPGNRGSISDTTGVDTINAAAVTSNLLLDLNPGATSTIAGRAVSTTADTLIENAYGGDGNDIITGNAASNYLYGGHGDDILDGGAGADILVGGSGDDIYLVDDPNDVVIEDDSEGTNTVQTTLANYILPANIQNLIIIDSATSNNELVAATAGVTRYAMGNALDNLIQGGAGDDAICGGAGNNILDGGAGTNTLDYSSAIAAIDIDLSKGLSINDSGGTDTFTNFVIFISGSGDDRFVGGAGDHVLAGNGGLDTLDYSAASFDAIFDLRQGLAYNYFGSTSNVDQISGIEIFLGGGANDRFIGGPGAHSFFGNGGSDTIDYSASASGVTFDVAHGSAYNNFSGATVTIDQFSNIEVFIGGSANDNFFGGPGSHSFVGNAGADTINYSAATTGVIFDIAHGTAYNNFSGPVVATDQFSSIEIFRGGSGDDSFLGGAGFHAFFGNGGSDTIDYSTAASGVTFDAGTGRAYHNYSGVTVSVDVFSDIEVFQGTSYNDNFFGGPGNHNFIGGDGCDSLHYVRATSSVIFDVLNGIAYNTIGGTSGNIDQFSSIEIFRGGSGDDVFEGGPGMHAFFGSGGVDILDYSSATTGVMFDLGTKKAYNTIGSASVNVDQFTGVEVFQGGSGRNSFIASNTSDTYSFIGGSNQDTFFFSAGFGKGTIINFTSGLDLIKLDQSEFFDFADVQFHTQQIGADTIIALDANNTITLQNVTFANLHATDFMFV